MRQSAGSARSGGAEARSDSPADEKEGSVQAGGSTRENLRAKLSLCSDLEAKLTNLVEQERKSSSTSNSNSSRAEIETRSSKIRTDLCELYCDIILSDADFAWAKDCVGRLWRSCFYGRITELRARITKERSRMKRCMSKDDADGAARHRKAVEGVERTLKDFLKEARKLFLYILDKYQSMLLPGKSHGEGVDSSTGEGGNERKRELFDPRADTQERKQQRRQPQAQQPPSDSQSSAVAHGVIPSLYKFLVYLGDIFRYVGDLTNATAYYTKAIRLAPGRGNPYNQLAVVAQLSDQTLNARPLTAVALYWYARSLLAVDEPFGTSKSNVERLFAMNREWVEKNVHSAVDADADDNDSALLLSTCSRSSSRKSGSRKAQAEASRAAKSAASRKFLAEFVDIHRELNRCVAESSSMVEVVGPEPSLTPMVSNKTVRVEQKGQEARMELSELAGKFAALNESFSVLLRVAAFSDSLMFKLVCVSAFTHYTAADTSRGHDGQILSATFIFSFGTAMAKQLSFNLEKIKKKGGEKNGELTIRLLHPFIVLCDLVSLFYGCQDSTDDYSNRMVLPRHIRLGKKRGEAVEGINAIYFEAERLFWSSVTEIANTLFSIDAFSVLVDSSRRHNESLLSLPLPKDYEELRGYAPFRGVFSLYEPSTGDASLAMAIRSTGLAESDAANPIASESNEATYVTPTKAIAVLGIETAALSQDFSMDGSKKGTKSAAEAHARVAHFLSFVSRHTIAPERGAASMEYGHFLFLQKSTGNVDSMLKTDLKGTLDTSLLSVSGVTGGLTIEGTTEGGVDLIAKSKAVDRRNECCDQRRLSDGDFAPADGFGADNGDSPPSVEAKGRFRTHPSELEATFTATPSFEEPPSIQLVPESDLERLSVVPQKNSKQKRRQREEEEEIALQPRTRPLAPPGFADVLASSSGALQHALEIDSWGSCDTRNPFLLSQAPQQEVSNTRGANPSFPSARRGPSPRFVAGNVAVPTPKGFGIFGSYEDILFVGAEDEVEHEASRSNGIHVEQNRFEGLQQESKNPFCTR